MLHCRGDRVALLEERRYMARLIPGASFIELPGNHHALLALAGTAGFDYFLEEATNFIVMHDRWKRRLIGTDES